MGETYKHFKTENEEMPAGMNIQMLYQIVKDLSLSNSFLRNELEEVKKQQQNVEDLSERPVFKGDARENPVHFLDQFEDYCFDRKVVYTDNLKEVLTCLKGSARNWAEIKKMSWNNNYQQFKDDFLSFYWSENKQMTVKRKILEYSYQYYHDGMSMSKYFIKQFSDLNTLTVIQDKKMLIDNVMRQFPPHVISKWIVTSDKTVDSALHLLQDMDIIRVDNNRVAKRLRFAPCQQALSSNHSDQDQQKQMVNDVSNKRGLLGIMDKEEHES